MVRFLCTHCNYKYRPKDPSRGPPRLCSNCGKDGTVVVEPDAEQLLAESNIG